MSLLLNCKIVIWFNYTIADLVDSGKIRSTTTTVLNGLTASNFIKAHSILESGTSTGKIVVVY